MQTRSFFESYWKGFKKKQITNLRILMHKAREHQQQATLVAELQELVGRLERDSHKYSLLINVDKTKVMASDGTACRILI